MTALLFDTETHDRDNPEIIEAAWMEARIGESAHLPHGSLRYPMTMQMFQPSKPITLGAMSTHHITDEMLIGCDPSCTFELPPCDFLIGHNVDFDAGAAGVMGDGGPKRIDTCSLARAIWPDLDCYSQAALIYHLDRQNARERLKGAHGAAADILLCKSILDAEIAATGVQSWEELWQRSEDARTPVKMYWGKHEGMPLEDLPKDYVHWLLFKANNPPIDPYLRRALENLGKDRQAQRTLFCPQ